MLVIASGAVLTYSTPFGDFTVVSDCGAITAAGFSTQIRAARGGQSGA